MRPDEVGLFYQNWFEYLVKLNSPAGFDKLLNAHSWQRSAEKEKNELKLVRVLDKDSKIYKILI